MQPRSKSGLPPNNRLNGWDATPKVKWHDQEILSRAGIAPDPSPVSDADQARTLIKLFADADQPTPTLHAVMAWARRGAIPDRWRAALVYLMIREKLILPSQLFQRTPTA